MAHAKVLGQDQARVPEEEVGAGLAGSKTYLRSHSSQVGGRQARLPARPKCLSLSHAWGDLPKS